MNILEKLAALSRERERKDREQVPEEEMREAARAMGPGG